MAAFEQLVRRNEVIDALLPRLAALDLPDWYLTAGCLFQTVWNELSGRPATTAILDFDVFYFDPDLSWTSEDRVIRRCAATCADLAVEVQVRNQARVHLWYEGRFGVTCPPLHSNMIVRPNPVVAPRSVYEAKTERWAREWSDLSVLPWGPS